MEVAIIGGGASGFFAAITAKENFPEARVVIFEKSNKVLAKVKVSGGGRCNLTNAAATVKELLAAYPRGGKVLKKAFRVFNNHDAMAWFTRRGVPLVIQEDNCVFPRCQDSQAIIDCLLAQAKRLGIGLELGRGVRDIRPEGDRLRLDFGEGGRLFDKVIVSTGGSPRRQGLAWLERLGHRIVEPVPSLFTFTLATDPITELQGIVVDNVLVSIPATKLKADGPLLITHWGMSGPAILKLSSFGARWLHEQGYAFTLLVNWVHEPTYDTVRDHVQTLVADHGQKNLANARPYGLPERLWRHLLGKCGLAVDKKWNELGKKGLHKLVTVLTHDEYGVAAKASFKDEFVTCGGVSLDGLDPATMQSTVCPNLYFTGEVLDIDGITGGYNFQAAWTTAFIAGRLQ